MGRDDIAIQVRAHFDPSRYDTRFRPSYDLERFITTSFFSDWGGKWTMRNLVGSLLFGFLAAGIALSAANTQLTTVQGVLIDKQCSSKAETRVVSGPRIEGGILVAYTHTRQCALLPECQKSGYGVFTYDGNTFLPFDEEGNRKALAIFKNSKKEDDFRVEVAGRMQGDVLKVVSIKLLD
jgi:hypothetical protein